MKFVQFVSKRMKAWSLDRAVFMIRFAAENTESFDSLRSLRMKKENTE